MASSHDLKGSAVQRPSQVCHRQDGKDDLLTCYQRALAVGYMNHLSSANALTRQETEHRTVGQTNCPDSTHDPLTYDQGNCARHRTDHRVYRHYQAHGDNGNGPIMNLDGTNDLQTYYQKAWAMQYLSHRDSANNVILQKINLTLHEIADYKEERQTRPLASYRGSCARH